MGQNACFPPCEKSQIEAFDAAVLFGWGFNEHSVPVGLLGGKSAKPAKLVVHQVYSEVKEYNETNIFLSNKAGDICEYHFMTGGGVGGPFERDPERVREDVRNEPVSMEKAKEEYGVVINPMTIEVDAGATEGLRKARKR